jgi:hypothetical protein
MSDDDDLRDEFGARLTAALTLRSRSDDATEPVAVVQRAARRQQARRRAFVGACAIAAAAAAVLLVVGLDRGGHGVRTITPSNTTQAPVSTTSSSSSTSTSTTTPVPPPPKITVVTASSVGSLRFGVATAADVSRQVGAPDADVRGSFGTATLPGYQALGYDCSNIKTKQGIHIGPYGSDTPPYCHTVYFINVNTSTLAGFETTASNYSTARATTVGMTESAAQQREGRSAVAGCFTGIRIGSAAPSGFDRLFVFVGVRSTDQVSSIAADSSTNSVGVLFC